MADAFQGSTTKIKVRRNTQGVWIRSFPPNWLRYMSFSNTNVESGVVEIDVYFAEDGKIVLSKPIQ